MGASEAQENFSSSSELSRIWPAAYRKPRAVRALLWRLLSVDLWQAPPYHSLLPTLTAPELAPFLPWLMGSDADAVAIANRAVAAAPGLLEAADLAGDAYRHLAAASLVRRDFPRAELALAHWSARLAASNGTARTRDMVEYFRIALWLVRGDTARAGELQAAVAARAEADPDRAQGARLFADWARAQFQGEGRSIVPGTRVQAGEPGQPGGIQ